MRALGFFLVCIAAFALVTLTSGKRRTCPKGCHGCGRCMSTQHRTPERDRYSPAEREAQRKKNQ